MPDWKQLEGDLSVWLQSFSRPGVEFRGPYQAIPGFPYDGFRSDGLLTDGSVLVAIEVEAGQMHPDTNVGKYWLLGRHYEYRKIVLFHVYTPDFNSYGWRKQLGEFYAEKMAAEVPIEYVLLDRRDATDYDATLSELRGRIEPRVKAEFPGAA
jgi:hypothetical protein